MPDDLNMRPMLLLILKIMRAMLWFCIAGLVLVGGGIWYSVTKVQGRAYEHFTNADTVLFSFIAGLTIIAALLLIGVHRMLRPQG
jgi:hypothetical protein